LLSATKKHKKHEEKLDTNLHELVWVLDLVRRKQIFPEKLFDKIAIDATIRVCLNVRGLAQESSINPISAGRQKGADK
jgi:hypothetical protein